MEPTTPGPTIAATATVHPGARVHPTAVIGAYCIVEDEVEIGPHNRLDPFAIVKRYTTLGEGNHLYSGAQLGTDPMDKKFREENSSYLRVGNHNVLREYVNISRGTKPGAITVLGDDNYVMSSVHIAHDCQLGSHITIGPSTSLGGYAEIEDSAFLSAGVGVHQFSKVGRLSMVAANTRVAQDVPPYLLVSEFDCAAHEMCIRDSGHVLFDVNGAVGALGQSFADVLPDALGAGAQGDHFSAVLFLEPQPGFQRVGIRLVDFVSQAGFFDPLARSSDAQL